MTISDIIGDDKDRTSKRIPIDSSHFTPDTTIVFFMSIIKFSHDFSLMTLQILLASIQKPMPI